MFEYTVQAFDKTEVGNVNVIQITVTAHSESDAIAKAMKIQKRSAYSVIAIRELGKEFKKG